MTINITAACAMCHKPHTITVVASEYREYRRGTAHIQDAMPSASADDREFLISKTCPACWEKLFGDEE